MAGTSLEEMVSGGVKDYIEQQQQKSQEAAERLREAAEEIRDLEARVADRNELAERLGVIERTLERTENERDKLAASVEDLGRQLGAIEALGDQPARAKDTKKKVPGEDNLYSRELAGGETVYLVRTKHPDDGSKSKWETVGPDLDEARARRDELVGTPETEAVTII
jgi:DNA repair exonuclease SbcCD ATPase subunit